MTSNYLFINSSKNIIFITDSNCIISLHNKFIISFYPFYFIYWNQIISMRIIFRITRK
nr:MAG TPA: hypothetical protein [Caudoviricetes sp.]